jgi:hypothetical protein
LTDLSLIYFCQQLNSYGTRLVLEKLDLSLCHISNRACVKLAESLQKVKTIQAVNLKNNVIDYSGAEALLLFARQNASITKINLE